MGFKMVSRIALADLEYKVRRSFCVRKSTHDVMESASSQRGSLRAHLLEALPEELTHGLVENIQGGSTRQELTLFCPRSCFSFSAIAPLMLAVKLGYIVLCEPPWNLGLTLRSVFRRTPTDPLLCTLQFKIRTAPSQRSCSGSVPRNTSSRRTASDRHRWTLLA